MLSIQVILRSLTLFIVCTSDAGDIGFDPLGFKPQDPAEFEEMQTKELSNGRLAMIAVAGMCVQELVTQKPLL